MNAVILSFLAGCGGIVGTPAPADRGDVACEGDSLLVVVDALSESPLRTHPNTELTLCQNAEGQPHGRHVERLASGNVVVEGRWQAGVRDGTWTTWTPEGVFDAREDYVQGDQQGLRQVLGRAGAVVQLTIDDGVVIELATLPAQTPMPEWDHGVRSEGVRHRPAASPEGEEAPE